MKSESDYMHYCIYLQFAIVHLTSLVGLQSASDKARLERLVKKLRRGIPPSRYTPLSVLDEEADKWLFFVVESIAHHVLSHLLSPRKKRKPKLLSQTPYLRIRAAIQRYLQPYTTSCTAINIVKGSEFPVNFFAAIDILSLSFLIGKTISHDFSCNPHCVWVSWCVCHIKRNWLIDSLKSNIIYVYYTYCWQDCQDCDMYYSGAWFRLSTFTSSVNSVYGNPRWLVPHVWVCDIAYLFLTVLELFWVAFLKGRYINVSLYCITLH